MKEIIKMSSLLNAKQTAKLLNINLFTLYSLSRRKAIPTIKIGKLVRYDQNDLEAWLQEQKVKTGK